MANLQPIVEVGTQLRLKWPTSEDTERKATVIEVCRSSKMKHDSWYKYVIQFKDNDECVETRLKNLEFKVKNKDKEKEGSTDAADAQETSASREERTDGTHKKKKAKREADDAGDSKYSSSDNDISSSSNSKSEMNSVAAAAAALHAAVAWPISHVMKRAGRPSWNIPIHKYICAPMVGASELAFRLLTRRYGCQLAYTPMISSARFAVDEEYRKQEFQTIPADRPLVCHFSANDPAQMLAAARHVENRCDAIDLNLGCPQRVAFVGHYGSFLLDDVDRPLVLSIVRTLAENISIPVFVKIRLLNTVAETIALCQQLAEAGAALIAIHARYRVNLVDRTGPGARDGAAFLDQVAVVRQALPSSVVLISNGNIREHSDLEANLDLTGANGLMSAEGLLDNPAIFSGEFHNKDRLDLAMEYLDLVKQHPVSMKCLVFHVRRMARDALNKYQMMDECVSCTNSEAVRDVINQCKVYRDKGNYEFDAMKEIRARKELERRKHEEGKRKRYEERMTRKAKREGKDASFYLMQGAETPTIERLRLLRAMPKEKAFEEWKNRHSQHCYDFHFSEDKCKRDRTCAFLHADPAFVSNDAEKFG